MAPATHLPLHRLAPWQPFRLDALGLITLLGAEEVNRAIGGLQHSWLTEYLPLMGAFMVAGNKFTEPLPGYKGYNITDGIVPPELSGPFTRWVDHHIYSGNQQVANTTILTWSLAPKEQLHIRWTRQLAAVLIGAFLNLGLLAMTILMADWYGIANSVAMITSVVVRWSLLSRNRHELGTLAKQAQASLDDKTSDKGRAWKKMLVEPPSSNKIVVNHMQSALIPCMLTALDQSHQRSYKYTRMVGWAAFAIQIISIGQANLVTQLMTVGIMTFATLATIYRIGCSPEEFGHFLRVRTEPADYKRRQCFVELDCTPDEEAALKRWSLLPMETNQVWYTDYADLKDQWRIKKEREAKEKREEDAKKALATAQGAL